jgi:uncharacterized protein YdeI (YjbR/CyaY-like superfamily)
MQNKMEKSDPRIDEYINNSQEFAKPILNHLRHLVHLANPEIHETIKWGFASFDYKGPLCSMASFKNHVVFGFWKSELLNDPDGYVKARSNQGGEAMGNFGRITAMSDLPLDDVIVGLVKQAVMLNDAKIKLPRKPKLLRQELLIPDYFNEALKENAHALHTFESFSYSNKKEYVEWFSEAKTEKTKNERLVSAIQWLSEGKTRNWKYLQKK